MIDNHPDARFQAGLSDAGIIYEMEAEANIPRIIALFYNSKTRLIGPIRSLRPYFFDYIKEHDGLLVRYGGSPNADNIVYSEGYEEIDGMTTSSEYIWRSSETGTVAPHNAFTNPDAIEKAIKTYGYKEELDKNPVFKFSLREKKNEKVQGKTCNKITFSYTSGLNTSYTYSDYEKEYKKMSDGKDHIDFLTQKPLSFKNILVQKVYMGFESDGVHRTMDNVGEGEGYYLTNGKIYNIRWKKEDKNSPTKYFLQDEELELNPGKTAVQINDISKNIEIE